MPYEITNEFPNEWFDSITGPCISLYQPTHRYAPANQQDPIRFKNLVKQIEQSLNKQHSKKEIDSLLEPLETIAKDKMFWQHTADGLAIFATQGKCIVYRLQRPVKTLAIVANSFHVKPLIRIYQSSDRYHLLGLNRNMFTLFEGNRYGLERDDSERGFPRTSKEALGEKFKDPYITAGSYKGPSNRSAMFHGHGSKKDEVDKDTERFFRYVDQTVLEHYSRPLGLPLYLVALDEHHTPFQSISRNPLLQKEGIKIAYDALTLDQLNARAWQIIEPIYLQKTQALVEQFESARAQDLGSDRLEEVASAAIKNKISRILIEADRILPGSVDLKTGELITGNLENPETDDVLDDLAEIVFDHRGEVVVVPKERMPSETGVAAIYRA